MESIPLDETSITRQCQCCPNEEDSSFLQTVRGKVMSEAWGRVRRREEERRAEGKADESGGGSRE